MLIGNQYSDEKMYRGIRHYDSLPLSSEDIHEYSDTISRKNAFLYNNVIGQGILNTYTPTLDSNTIPDIRFNEPIVLLIDGDIVLIQTSEGTPILTLSQVKEANYSEGLVCVVGWYQHITSSSTLYAYGGVDNSTIENDLENNKFGIQFSSRYQFRWTIIHVDNSYKSAALYTGKVIDLPDRDSKGILLGTTSQVSISQNLETIFLADAPATMDYAESPLYIVPIVEYKYNGQRISDINTCAPVAAKGSSAEVINSEDEPTGEYPSGTTWFNPITREFKTYIEGIGFIGNTSTMGFLQYQSIYELPTDFLTAQDIQVPINISELEDGDILQVNYEGLVLVQGENYNINYENNTITLLNFTVEAGDRVTFTVVKIVEANDITNITITFTSHMDSTASNTREAHVKLSDEANANLDTNSGIAATPKAVYEATMVKDESTGVKYKFGVAGGLLYLEEV